MNLLLGLDGILFYNYATSTMLWETGWTDSYNHATSTMLWETGWIDSYNYATSTMLWETVWILILQLCNIYDVVWIRWGGVWFFHLCNIYDVVR